MMLSCRFLFLCYIASASKICNKSISERTKCPARMNDFGSIFISLKFVSGVLLFHGDIPSHGTVHTDAAVTASAVAVHSIRRKKSQWQTT